MSLLATFLERKHQTHHQHDRNRSEHRDGKSNTVARHRSKSHIVDPTKERQLARSKSPYSRGLQRQDDARSKSSARSKSPYPEQKECSYNRDDDDESSSSSCSSSQTSRDDSDEDTAQEEEFEHLKRSTRMDVAFTIHSFSFRRKKEENGSFYPEFVPSATNGRKLEVNRCL
ncbi:hypothetical protein QTG54_014138 [Skeletonema marinoi]|uniref:Uncharacterized protein n=1 Tax=Skeletonema marinoi TaxID=267567 RepID=A0AAD9D5Z4_9STRA|nr:hypothetical protein QTG54_014138 [Skeletonema marinoi]